MNVLDYLEAVNEVADALLRCPTVSGVDVINDPDGDDSCIEVHVMHRGRLRLWVEDPDGIPAP